METIPSINQSTVLITDLPDEILLVIFWQLLWSFDENDENTPFNELAEWHYACLAYLSQTCRHWHDIVEHTASFWTLLSAILSERLRAKILRMSGSLPLDITYDYDSDVKGVYSRMIDGFVPQDMMKAFPRWKAATLRFETAECVPSELYNRSLHQLQTIDLSVDDTWGGTRRGLLGGNTDTLRHLRLSYAEHHFPTSPLASLRTLHVDGMFRQFIIPMEILAALQTTRMLKELTLCFQTFSSLFIPDWNAERLRRTDIVELPNLRKFRLEVDVDVGIFLLRHITGPSCNHLNFNFPCVQKLSPIAELRQALTWFVPCIQKAFEASSRTRASIALSEANKQTVATTTNQDSSHTLSLVLSFAFNWLTEIFEWLDDLVSPLSQEGPFVWLFLMTRQDGSASGASAPLESDGWIQAIAPMRSVHTLDLGRLYQAHRGIFEPLSKPIENEESPRWPLASLERLVIRENANLPLEVLKLLKARSRKNSEPSGSALAVQLAELVLLVEGKSHSEKWVDYIPAIEEALLPGRLIVEYLNYGD